MSSQIMSSRIMPSRIAPTMGPLEWALLIALSVLWGGTFFFAEVALRALDPLSLVLARVGLAAAPLIVIVYATGHRLPRRASVWGAFFVMGALNNLLPFSLIFWGQTRIAGGLAAILIATTPLFTVVLAHFLTRDEPISASRLGGVLLGIAGVTVLIGPGALRGAGLHLLAQIAVLGAALAYALAGIFGRRFSDLPPVVSAAGQVTASTVLLLGIVVLLDWPLPGLALSLPTWGPPTWGAVLGLALLGTALAYVIYFRLLARAGATNLLLVTFLIPVSAIALGAGLLGERLEVQHLAGMGLIGLGLGAIDGRPLRLLRHRRRARLLKPTVSPKSS
jgi:drug/metabolite transporter (DMT)-like permease